MDKLGESTASDDRIERLFSILNHELRTPITCLQGSLDLLQTGHLGEMNETGQSVLQLANESVDRLSQLINNLLVWFELTYPEHPLFKQPCDGVRLITQVAENLEALAADHHVHICIQLPAAIPLLADYIHLTYALQHLLKHAIRCSLPDRIVRVEAIEYAQSDLANSVQAIHLARPLTLISIQKEGVEMPEEQISNIFQPLPQIASLEDWKYGDLGLELALCYQIIRHHDGILWVENVVNQGSTFYLALPIMESVH